MNRRAIKNYQANPEVLLRDIQKGEESAFAFLFRQYYGPLYNYAGRLLRDRHLADDIVQEVFCKFFERHFQQEWVGSIQSYLYKSVYTHCLNYIRDHKTKEKFIAQEYADIYYSTVIQDPQAEISMATEANIQLLWDAIEILPERCRQIFLLRKIEGWSHQEIATHLQISVKTVEAQITIALGKIRKQFKPVNTNMLCVFLRLVRKKCNFS